MKQKHVPWSILSVFLISFVYWIYRFFHSFSADLIDYQALGRILQHQGIIGYLMTGPHREPLYPLICAWAMNIEKLSGISFTHIMAGFGILMLLTTQILMYIILRQLNIRTKVSCLTLLYWGISPSINYSAFNVLLFCEILTYPFILAVVLAGFHGWEAIKQNNKDTASVYGAVSGLIFAVLTFVKAAFECICPAYLIVFLIVAIYKKKVSFSLICFLTAAGLLFFVPTYTYKCLNKIYNGNFVIADRGVQNLYGNVERRTQPLTSRKYLADLASTAGLCQNYFKTQECFFWSYVESDNLGYQESDELTARHFLPQTASNVMLRLSKEKALHHWPQYFLLTITEGLKMFFWEASRPSFPLTYVLAAITFFAIAYCFFYLRLLPSMMGHILVIVFIFVAFYSLFAILPRHILPLVPLYLIIIAYSLSRLFDKSPSKQGSPL